MTPIVLIEIDKNSRLHVLQDAGVRIIFVDRRVDDEHLTIFSEQDQAKAINHSIRDLSLVSRGADDGDKSAQATLRRLANGDVIVAGIERK